MTDYEVVVGNIGTVYNGIYKHKAVEFYEEYVNQSQTDYLRASGEDVTLFEDGEILQEHAGTINQDA